MATKKAAKKTDAKLVTKMTQPVEGDMAATYVNPSKLKPWDKNPRINDHAVDDIIRSIKEFGFGRPILVRKADNRIIAGHTTHKAALKMGLALVPARFLDITEKQADALTVADNKLGEKATWDDKLLSDILKGLENDIDLGALGMEASELATLLAVEPEIIPDAGGDDARNTQPGNGGNARPEGEPSHVRMIQLFFDTTTQPVFAERCRVLAEKYGTANITDTVFKAVEEAHAQRSSAVAAE